MREYLRELSMHLVSLKDNGFEILNNETTIRVQNDRPFNLSEVKDDLIPFIHILNSDHDIVVRVKGYRKFKLFGLLKPRYVIETIPINKILKDKYNTELTLSEIDIVISKKIPADIKKFIDDFLKKY